MNEEKKWYKSKTMQLNLVSLLGAISGWLSGEMTREVAITAIAMSVINVVLRVKTKGPVKA